MCDDKHQKIWTPDGYLEDEEEVPRGLYRAKLDGDSNEDPKPRDIEFIGTTTQPAKIARAVLAGKPPNLMGSKIHRDYGGQTFHAPLFDFDQRMRIKKSSSFGHHHILLDQYVQENLYFKLMKAMSEAGVLQWGFSNQTETYGQTFIRWNTTKGEEE